MEVAMTLSKNDVAVGKYSISPMTKLVENGWYACSVSIRCCCGASHRVVRLTRLFRDKTAASAYALREGMRWIGQTVETPQLAIA
jgi:hypothetical protein